MPALKETCGGHYGTKQRFHVTTIEGNIEEVETEELKAIYFVKDYDGDKTHEYSYSDTITGGGRKVRVSFADGEEMVGYTQGYSPNKYNSFKSISFVLVTAPPFLCHKMLWLSSTTKNCR